ncbi:serine/threonine protein kinase [Saprolegnia parasitica CBS 223.65]|uniref:Serine/threonine protein kinase n=1 Tax=Saprolegnia parasitica (strain CBS 223.65) TaxID=695850 RepID=A0A067CVD1_SAPPC|nr:serine/threonine protein kinase [Saprolegnia parasitica CBS 223.65]KDO30496.1 serine/threonine protein kinase [Saprolegnia parasitica CBS 223.65]|eukprot:XP_012198714.1 serine/threonine protein kinase [Saprolegnia parasitica CBS 223.65]
MVRFPSLTVEEGKLVTKGLFYETGAGNIKVYLKSLPKYAHSDVRLLFDKEIALHEQLRHPNIVKLYDASPSSSKEPIMVFEYMDEGSLDTHFGSGADSFTDDRKVRIVRDIAQAIAHLHNNDMTHGNLLPSHVLLDSVKPAKLTGLCSNEQADSQLEISAVQLNVASCFYVAPEVILDDATYEPPADVFAFGCLMWCVDIVHEIYPTNGGDVIEFRHIMDWISSGGFDDVARDFSPSCPGWYAAIAKLCMRRDPNERPTIQQVLRQLEKDAP